MKQFEGLLKTKLKTGGGLNGGIAEVSRRIKGQSTLNVMAALNAMVAASDGVYLEIGTLYGKSLCGAMVGNGDRIFIGIDNFQGSGSPERIEANVKKLFPHVNFRFYPMGFRQFFKNHAADWRGRVSAYFYDADHSLVGQRDGLRLAVESGVLAAEAFVAVDDYSWPDTKQAVGEFLAARPEWRVVLEEEDDWNRRGWWNGLVVLYRSGRGVERPKEVR